ncbi:hypothetical protein U9M48_004812, partial [Paspalum notatum var. saurae]
LRSEHPARIANSHRNIICSALGVRARPSCSVPPSRQHRTGRQCLGSISWIIHSICTSVCSSLLVYFRDVTDNFSSDREIGRGGFGVVYKGVDAQSGAVTAVKKLRPISGAQDKQFKNEANILARVDHHNIVKLIGYCDEMQEKLLCYEYLPKGSLDSIIYDEPCGLEWRDRYKIVVGICQGLYYLHEGLDNTPIIHMDLKPSNILLDDRMEPKIADFGLSRLFGEEQSLTCTENLMGSIGYMAPEYWNRGEISTKSDIYSLGILILEIVTGKKNHQVMGNKSGEHFIEDVRKVWTHMSQKASKNLSLGSDCLQQVHRCIEIGLSCVEADKERRPTSGQLLWLILSAGGCTRKVDEDPMLQGRRVVAAEKTKSSWSLAETTLKIVIRFVASVLILLNLNRSRSWAITALKFVTPQAASVAIGTVVVVLILYLQKNLSSSWRRVILFAIGIVLAAALFLLNSSIHESQQFMATGGLICYIWCPGCSHLTEIQQHMGDINLEESQQFTETGDLIIHRTCSGCSSGPTEWQHSNVMGGNDGSEARRGYGAVLSMSLVLLNPASPWSWVLMTLKVTMAAGHQPQLLWP